MEGRGLTERNTLQANSSRTQRRDQDEPSGLERVRHAAQRDRKARFTSLLHHITIDLLRYVFYRMNRKASPGVDGMTWEAYEKGLEERLQDLHGRVQRGAYRAKPSLRTYIPKADGGQRPLGLATFEDKLLQGAVVEVMNCIYEVDFCDESYGFRRGRGQHDALDALATAIIRRRVNWVLDADIRGFFDSIDHALLMKGLEHRIGDRRLLRLIQKWLNAGAIDGQALTRMKEGTPQGAAISPLLANIYLHYVLDLWLDRWSRKRARGEVYFVRYADDFVVCFQRSDDANRFLRDLRERLAECHLALHDDKTRLIEFGTFAVANREQRGDGKPPTFDFLGFTHICGKDRRGRYQLRRKPIKKRMRAKLREIKVELRRRMHLSILAQSQWLTQLLRGYFGYYAVPTSYRSLAAFRQLVIRLWYRTLRRRSQRHRLTWKRMRRLEEALLPKLKIRHPWPDARHTANTQGRSPVR